MKINMLALMAMLGLVFAAPIAKAEDAPAGGEGKPPFMKHDKDDKKMGGKHFAETDKDGDGFLTKDEMLEFHKRKLDKMFDKSDADKDGKLSREELSQGHKNMREEFKKRFEERKKELEKALPETPADKKAE